MAYLRKFRPLLASAIIASGLFTLHPSGTFAQSSLPSPWFSQDIGSPAIVGGATLSSGTFTIEGAGYISGTSDQFQFVYQPMTGDGEVVALVESVTADRVWSKAGVMMRETLTGGSRHVFALASARKGVALQWRSITDGSSTSTAGTMTSPPRWVRLVRRGDTFQAYESADGQTWQSIGGSTMTMASTIYVGLAVASQSSKAASTATISNVNVSAAATNQLPTVSLSTPADGATYIAPATIGLSASASDPDGTISKVDFYSGSTLLGSDTVSPYSYSWGNVPSGTYTLTAVATDDLGAKIVSAARTVTVSAASGSVPPPWTADDVGSPAIAGSATESGGTFTVSGAGVDIWDTADQFQFVHQLLTGDGTIVAKVESLTPVNPYSKAGVMMRETLDAGSRHALMHASPSHGMRFLRRTETGGTTVSTAGSAVTAPYWVRLVRRGDVFESYESPDGSTWSLLGSEIISMTPTIYVGLVVGSVDATTAATGTFSNVTVTEAAATNEPPTVTLTAPANGATYTAPATVTLSAAASDSDGSVSRVDFYRGSTLIASDTASPYSVIWSNVAAGSYTLTAVAIDDTGDTTTSSAVNITVNSTTNAPPTVSVTSPVSGSSYAAPTTLSLAANASDSDGTIAKVDFYAGTTLVGSDTTSPYSVNWANAAPGTYSLTARATDNSGAVTTSTAISVTLRPSQAVFTASTDDATVTSYRLDIFLAGADPATATPMATKDLGKPTPVNGDITVDITGTLQPLAAGTYFATVTAINSGGSSRSAPSANFTR